MTSTMALLEAAVLLVGGLLLCTVIRESSLLPRATRPQFAFIGYVFTALVTTQRVLGDAYMVSIVQGLVFGLGFAVRPLIQGLVIGLYLEARRTRWKDNYFYTHDKERGWVYLGQARDTFAMLHIVLDPADGAAGEVLLPNERLMSDALLITSVRRADAQ